MNVELHASNLLDRLQRVAAERTQSIEQVLETAVQAYLDRLDQEALHAETEAFWAMHETLVEQYAGQHVAVYQEEVVDADPDARRLERRVRERFGTAPVLIAPVQTEPRHATQRRDLRWRGGRIERPEAS
jgi:hypothetical protein